MNGEEIINRILEELNIKAPTFAESIRVSYQRVYDVQTGKTKKISSQLAALIVRVYPQFNISWLLTGIGEPMVATNEDEEMKRKQAVYSTYLLPQSAMGGTLSGFSAEQTSLHHCESVVTPIANVDFAITIYGESMAPEYPSGSRVLIKRINPDIFIDWGSVNVLDTSNGVILKEVHTSEKDGCVKCCSINPDPKFKPFDIQTSEIYGWYRVLMCMAAK